MKKAGCIIDGKVQHDWGEWGEWHYHKYNFYYPRRRIGLIATTIGGRGYEQRVRVCRRCREFVEGVEQESLREGIDMTR